MCYLKREQNQRTGCVCQIWDSTKDEWSHFPFKSGLSMGCDNRQPLGHCPGEQGPQFQGQAEMYMEQTLLSSHVHLLVSAGGYTCHRRRPYFMPALSHTLRRGSHTHTHTYCYCTGEICRVQAWGISSLLKCHNSLQRCLSYTNDSYQNSF